MYPELYFPMFEKMKTLSSRAQVELLRQVTRDDPWFRGYYVLGFKHWDSEHIRKRTKWFYEGIALGCYDLFLCWARGHLKSSFMYNHLIGLILKDQNIRIGYISGTEPKAQAHCEKIQEILERNDILKGLFPEIFYQNPRKDSIQEGGKWKATQFCVKQTRATQGKTLTVWGILSQPAGIHTDLNIHDDTVVVENVGSQEMRDKVKERIAHALSISEPGSITLWAGTRYHMDDAWGTVMKRKKVKVSFLPALDTAGEPRFPEKFSKQALEDIRDAQGDYIFNCQYMLKPISKENQAFLPSWFRKNQYKELPENVEWRRVLVVDPANALRKRSDFTAMWVIFINPQGELFLEDGLRDKLNSKQRQDMVFAFAKQYELSTVLYETVAFQETDKFWIDVRLVARAPTDYCNFQVSPINRSVSGKNDRLLCLITPFQNSIVHVKQDIGYYSRFLKKRINLSEAFYNDEYLLFPFAVHDDLLDALQMAQSSLYARPLESPKSNVQEFPEGSVGWYKQQMIEQQKTTQYSEPVELHNRMWDNESMDRDRIVA